MGHEPVNAPHQEVVRQILFQPAPFLPAVVAKNFAQAAPLFARVNGRQRAAQVPQHIVVKQPAAVLPHQPVGAIPFSLGQHLPANAVDAGHVLAGKPPEIMSQGTAAAKMLVVVLDQMADVFHPVLVAPAADLPGKIPLYGAGDSIHVCKAHPGSGTRVVLPFPQQRQIANKVFAPFGAQF
jgi:hypothetical protein